MNHAKRAEAILSRQHDLELELWLLALCWLAGWRLPWSVVERCLQPLVYRCRPRARA